VLTATDQKPQKITKCDIIQRRTHVVQWINHLDAMCSRAWRAR